MTSNRKFTWAFLMIIIAIISVILLWRSGDSEEIRWEFKGPVENAVNGEDGATMIKVHGKEYDLSNIEWGLQKIFKGDTVIKKKGDKYIKIIRTGTKDTIYFNKEF